MARTLKAMERISEIRAKRERMFYKKRMAGNRARQLAEDRKLVQTHSHLLPRMRGSEKRRLQLEQGLTEEEIAELPVVEEKKAKAFGKEKIRQKVRVDGDIEFMGVADDGMDMDSDDE